MVCKLFPFFSELKVTRARLLQQLADSRNDVQLIEKSMNEYVSLLQGLCEDVVPQTAGEEGAKGGSSQGGSSHGDGKLRKVEVFKWTNTICGNTST